MKPAAILSISAALLVLTACGPAPQPAAPASRPAPKAVLADLSYMMPDTQRVSSKQVDGHLFDHGFLPGGTLSHYKDGAREWDVAVADMKSGPDAALALLAWKGKLDDAKVVPHFGGYAGKDGGRATFIFVKEKFLCAVVGLPQAEADQFARRLAARVR